MSTNASFTSLKKVKPFKTKWRSQVILLHFWQQTTSFGETRQMVLADEYVSFANTLRYLFGTIFFSLLLHFFILLSNIYFAFVLNKKRSLVLLF